MGGVGRRQRWLEADRVRILAESFAPGARVVDVARRNGVAVSRVRWQRHVMVAGKIDRTHWEMATYGALANALASGDIWVPTSRMHRSLDVLLARSPHATPQLPFSLGDPHAWLDQRAEQLDSALRGVARNLDGRDAALFAGERLRFPKEQKDDDGGQDEGRHLTLACYGMLPATRITDVLSQVERWTGFTRHFSHVVSASAKLTHAAC